jgi:hypothetical protein
MNRPKLGSIAIDAFYDAFTCAALFGRLRIPGAPPELIDPRPLKKFAGDELQLSIQDFIKEIGRIEALVRGLRSVADPADNLISTETLQALLRSWSESSLKPLENPHQSR